MRRWLAILIPVVALGGLIAWRLNVKKAEAASQEQQRQARKTSAPTVSVSEAKVRDIVHTFEALGNVEAPFNVKISPKVTGRIDFLQAREGDRVTAGQVLVRIDPTDVEAQVRQAQANVAEARSRLAQAEITQAPTNVNIATQIRQQQAALESTQADANQASQNYNSQVAAAQSAVTDAQARVTNAEAARANAQASIRSAQANLNNAQTKLNRVNELYSQGYIAAQDVDDAKTTVSVQQGALDVAKGQLDSATAARDSAQAQVSSAQEQASIVKTKGKADIAAAKAKVKQAQAALDYAKANTAQRPAYQANLKALQASVDAAEAAVRSAESHRADTVLIAPISGSITMRYMDPGAVATSGQPILSVQSMQQVWVTIPVPEEVSRKVFLGQMAGVVFDALPGSTFTGKIVQINPSADPQSRQFQARVALDNPRNVLKPGMFGRVTLTTEKTPNAVVVPREAVQNGKDGASVTVIDASNKAEKRIVTVGASDPSGIAITSGVQSGEKVVIMSSVPVKDGATVRISGEGKKQGEGQRRGGA